MAVWADGVETSGAHWSTKVQAHGELPPGASEAGSGAAANTARRAAMRGRDRAEVSRGRSSREGSAKGRTRKHKEER